MKKDRWLLRATVLLVLSAALMSGASLAAEAGTAQDPLVTLSYLNDTFFNSIMQRVDQKIAQQTGQAGGASGLSRLLGDFLVHPLHDTIKKGVVQIAQGYQRVLGGARLRRQGSAAHQRGAENQQNGCPQEPSVFFHMYLLCTPSRRRGVLRREGTSNQLVVGQPKANCDRRVHLVHHRLLHMTHALPKPLFIQGPDLLQQDHGIPAQAAALVLSLIHI